MLSGDNNTRQKICYCSLNYLHKHLLSYYSINLCTCDTGVSSINPLLCSARARSAAWHYGLLPPPASESSSIPGFCAGQESVSGREKRICFPLSYKYHVRQFREIHWTSPPRPKISSPLMLANFSYGAVHLDRSSPGPCILFPFTSSFIRHSPPSVLLQEEGLD